MSVPEIWTIDVVYQIIDHLKVWSVAGIHICKKWYLLIVHSRNEVYLRQFLGSGQKAIYNGS